MNVGLVNINSSIASGTGALGAARANAEKGKFADLLSTLQSQNDGRGTISSEQIAERGRLNGDYTSGFTGIYTLESDKTARPTGAAANQANPHVQPKTIDKTSELYEKSMELESYFVKQMLSAMRKTVHKSQESDFAQQTYEDMLFDEYATTMTKNAGFGLADQIYLSLVK